MARFESKSEVVELAPGHDDASRARYREAQRELFRKGFRRVRDPVREVAYPDEPRDAALDAALYEDPDDQASLLVYADLLQQHGHPRGQLIALACRQRTAKNKVERALAEAEAERLQREVTRELMGALADRHSLAVDWRAGFIHEARISGTMDSPEDELFELLMHPSARLLRSLRINVLDDEEDSDLRALVDLLRSASPAPPLTRLELCNPYSYSELGNVGVLCSVYPHLEVFEIAGDAELTGLSLPHARRVSLQLPEIDKARLVAIISARWPALEEFELAFEAVPSDDDFRTLFAMNAPELEVVRIHAPRNFVAPAFAASPLARHARLVTDDDLAMIGYEDDDP